MSERPLVPAQALVATARRYLHVRWLHQGRSALGLDCVGHVVRVVHDLGLSTFDIANYGRLPSGELLLKLASEHAQRVDEPLMPGHLVVLRFKGLAQHLAFVGDYPLGGLSLIHAMAQSRRVVEHRLDDTWAARIVAVYRVPGVAY